MIYLWIYTQEQVDLFFFYIEDIKILMSSNPWDEDVSISNQISTQIRCLEIHPFAQKC